MSEEGVKRGEKTHGRERERAAVFLFSVRDTDVSMVNTMGCQTAQ